MKNKNKIAIGASIAAATAGIAGAYYFYGSDKGPKRRKKLKSWMVSMEAEVVNKLNEVKEINREAYDAVVLAVAKKYKQLKDVDPQEVIDFASRMRSHWKDIKKDIEKTARQTAKTATKGVKEAVTKKRA
jgi:hypothetical protein